MTLDFSFQIMLVNYQWASLVRFYSHDPLASSEVREWNYYEKTYQFGFNDWISRVAELSNQIYKVTMIYIKYQMM